MRGLVGAWSLGPGLGLLLSTARAEPAKLSCDEAREDARRILTKYCGECHVGSRKTAKPKALQVFDLDDPGFAAKLSQRRLRNAAWRLGEPLDARARPLKVSDEEKAAFQRFVDLEMERRGRSEP